MAVVVEDSFFVNSNSAQVTSLTIADVTAANNDRFILVSGAVSSATTDMTSVDRGSETFTKEATADATAWESTMWSVDSEPTESATDIVCTLTGAGRRAAASCIVMSNVNQATPVGTSVTDNGDAATSSSVTISGGDLTIDMLGTQGSSSSASTAPGTGQTFEVDNEASSDQSTRADNYMSYEAGETTMTWSWTTNANFGAIATPVNEATAIPVSNPPRLRPMRQWARRI